MKVIVGIPAHNVEKQLPSIIAKLQELSYEIIVCNDGSSDMTGTIAEKMGTIVIHHKKNQGYGAAIRSIFLKASEMNFDVLVTFDGDGQHNVSDIKSVIKPIIDRDSDIVIGSRFFGEKTSQIPKYREFGIKVITKLTNTATDKKINDAQSGFRAYSRKVLQEIIPSETGMGVSTEILIKANKKKFRVTEIPITVSYNGETSTHHPVSHGFSVVLSSMKFISIERPLSFYGIPGIVFLAIGLFFVVWTLQIFSETRQITTNIALIGVGTIIFGTMLLMTSIMLYSLVNVVREKHRE